MKWGSEAEFVMPGLVPGIHVLASLEQERHRWPGPCVILRGSQKLAPPAITAKPLRKDDDGKSISIPLEEIRSDVGFLLDGVVVAIDGVGDQRVARNDRVLVGPHRIQPDHRGFGAAVPFERGCALRLFAGRNGLCKNISLDEGSYGPQLGYGFPVHVKGAREAGNHQDQKSDNGSL